MSVVDEPQEQPAAAGGASVDATAILRRLREGEERAADELLPIVYEQLRATAGSYFRGQRADHTLQPTALVHEAYVKLVNSGAEDWESRGHFCAVAAKAMRQILTDHARAKKADKRRADGGRAPLTNIEAPSSGQAIELIALDDALSELTEANPRLAEIVSLRFFGGLNNQEIAEGLDTPLRTVEREWRRCRAWLEVRLGETST